MNQGPVQLMPYQTLMLSDLMRSVTNLPDKATLIQTALAELPTVPARLHSRTKSTVNVKVRRDKKRK